ncbi:efflux RND transporter permease subunit [Kangiella sp.]|uniref:efflux RND transporter permease subunit n=1 Tax=Kangiella sp. TaxID=1920245 RepID=UPI003A93CBA1
MGFCWVNKYRWHLLAMSIVIAVIFAVGAKNLTQTADYKVYFDKSNTQLMASEKLGDDYSQSDNLLFVIAPKSGSVFTKETLATVQKLTEESWQIPYSTRVDSITNFQHSYAQEDDLIIEDLVGDLESMTAADIQDIRSTALNEPNLINRLISDDAAVTGVNVTINFTEGKVDSQTREVVAHARNLIEETLASNPDIDMYLTGIVIMNNAFPETTEKDNGKLIPLMLLIILVGLYFLLRSITAVSATLLVMLLSIGAAVGVAGWTGMELNPVSGAAPIIILTVAVADCVHLLLSFVHYYRVNGYEKHKAMQEALRLNAKPVMLTSLSTIIGFLTMNFSDAPPFRELGNIAAVGIAVACFLSLTLLPALINILPVKKLSNKKPQNQNLSNLLRGIAGWVSKHPAKVLLVGIIAAVGLSAAAMKNELNEDFIRYFDESYDVRKSTEFALNNLTGIAIVEYDLPAKAGEKISQPEYMNNLEKFSNWLYEQPEVVHVNTFSDVVKRLNKNMNGDDQSFYTIPDNSDLISQYILLYETSLPYGLGITERVKLDKSATRMTVTLDDLTNNQLLAFEQHAQNWMADNLPAYMHSDGLGWSMMFGNVAQDNIDSMLWATAIALIVISFILIFPFRSAKLGVLSLIPNVLPALVALGIWGLTVGMIGLAASIITALTFGIVVDDSIHFISRYVHNRRVNNMNPQQALNDTYTSVGKAIVVTSIVLVIGFAILATSGFKVNSTIGYLSSLTLLVALIMDLTILPALLLKFDSWIFARDLNEDRLNIEQGEKV